VFVQGGWLLRIQTFILVGVKALRVYVVRVFIILSSFFIGILNSSVTSLQWAIVNYMVYDVECIIGCRVRVDSDPITSSPLWGKQIL
jgi:hypothetical protein